MHILLSPISTSLRDRKHPVRQLDLLYYYEEN